MLKTAAFTVQIGLKTQRPISKTSTAKLSIRVKKQVLSFLHFQFRKTLLFFEWKKMRVSLSALQFGKELLEVKGETEKKEFC